MKINRLYEITTILLNKGTVTAKELADRFDVSTRTIYRDIDVLSTAGVPVYMNKGSGGGIALLESYAMNRALISEAESESLLIALKTLQATQYPEVDKALEKIGALFKKLPDYDWVEVDFSPWGAIANEKNKFNEIKQAMLQRKVIRFVYVSGEGHRSDRLAEPVKLIFKGNAWYLIAYCRCRQQLRTFRISVSSAKAADYQRELVQLKLRFHAKALNRLYDYFDDAFISANHDGSYILKVSLPEGEWVYSYILSFGSLVEVIEPEHIRDTIIDRLRQALIFYEDCTLSTLKR
ncbi:MAG: hypothetical protein K0Q75_1650 [Anaerospora sp.]|nr:hypothetical protein [Anaerospora sp.]